MHDVRLARNEASMRQLHAFLLTVQRDPLKHIEDTKLQLALTSQGSLAKFEQPEAGISPMSLNTAKRAATALFGVDGYTLIDRLRLDCAKSLSSARSAAAAVSTKSTNRSLRARAESAERRVALLSEDLQIATELLRECMRQARAYAKRADAATQARCDKEHRDLLRMLSLLRPA
jgi:hypothetical protein